MNNTVLEDDQILMDAAISEVMNPGHVETISDNVFNILEAKFIERFYIQRIDGDENLTTFHLKDRMTCSYSDAVTILVGYGQAFESVRLVYLRNRFPESRQWVVAIHAD